MAFNLMTRYRAFFLFIPVLPRGEPFLLTEGAYEILRIVVAQLGRNVFDRQIRFREPFLGHVEAVSGQVVAEGAVRFFTENAA